MWACFVWILESSTTVVRRTYKKEEPCAERMHPHVTIKNNVAPINEGRQVMALLRRSRRQSLPLSPCIRVAIRDIQGAYCCMILRTEQQQCLLSRRCWHVERRFNLPIIMENAAKKTAITMEYNDVGTSTLVADGANPRALLFVCVRVHWMMSARLHSAATQHKRSAFFGGFRVHLHSSARQ